MKQFHFLRVGGWRFTWLKPGVNEFRRDKEITGERWLRWIWPKMKKTITVATCLIAACAVQPARGQSAMDWLETAEGAKHLSIPRYTETGKTLYAVIRVDSIHTEFEMHGFFHIGALPVAVLEGFTYEVKDPVPAAMNLAELPGWLGGDAARHTELRNVKFIASPASSLESRNIKFLDHERWELTGAVRLISGTNVFQAGKAILRVAGKRAGEVVLQSSPPTTNTFLFDKISEIPKTTAMTTASK